MKTKLEAETKMLGKCLVHSTNIDCEMLRNYSFVLQEYQIIADAILQLHESRRRIDAITVLNEIATSSTEKLWRGILSELINSVDLTPELKKRPFCGGEPEFHERDDTWIGVRCTGICSASVKAFRIKSNSAKAHVQAKQAAADLWNMRCQL